MLNNLVCKYYLGISYLLLSERSRIMSKVKVGVIGIGRGSMIWRYCNDADNAEVVAICDKWEEVLKKDAEKL